MDYFPKLYMLLHTVK